jgi:hypothetical protein
MAITRSSWTGLAAAAFFLSACSSAPKWADAPRAPLSIDLGVFAYAVPSVVEWRLGAAKPRNGVSEHRLEGRVDGASVYVTVRTAGPFIAIGNTDDLIADLTFSETLQPYRTLQQARFRPASRSVALCAEARDEGPLQPNPLAGTYDAPATSALRIRIVCVDPRTTTVRAEFAAWTFAQGREPVFSAAQRAALDAAAAGLIYQGR